MAKFRCRKKHYYIYSHTLNMKIVRRILFLCFSLVSAAVFAQFTPNNLELSNAVEDWVADPAAATLIYGHISTWDVSQVTDMSYLFANKSSFNDDISMWNVSSVTDMQYMFNYASTFNQPLDAWNVSSVTDMQYMFSGALVFNQYLNSWNVSSVTNMSYTFGGAKAFNQNLNAWIVSSVTDMSKMFYQATAFNGDLGNWLVNNVVNMEAMFNNATSFNKPLINWNVSSVTNMGLMFYQATAFNRDLSNWVPSSVSNMSIMFTNATTFNQSLGNWDISSVTGMVFMLNGTAMSTANYDATLIGWSQQTVQSGVNFGASGLVYCAGETARQSLINDDGWIINDGGDCVPPVTIYDYMIVEGVGSELFITKLHQLALDDLNALTAPNPPATLMDFVKGEVYNNNIFMEYDLQAIVDAINANN